MTRPPFKPGVPIAYPKVGKPPSPFDTKIRRQAAASPIAAALGRLGKTK